MTKVILYRAPPNAQGFKNIAYKRERDRELKTSRKGSKRVIR
jgi:hypothetical protein